MTNRHNVVINKLHFEEMNVSFWEEDGIEENQKLESETKSGIERDNRKEMRNIEKSTKLMSKIILYQEVLLL